MANLRARRGGLPAGVQYTQFSPPANERRDDHSIRRSHYGADLLRARAPPAE